MKLSKKILSVASSAALVAALAAGCSTGEVPPSAAPRPDYIPEDVVLHTAGIAKDTPLITVDGQDVTAEHVLYWASYSADQMAQQMAQYTGGDIDWTMDMGEGKTMKEYLLDNAIETAKLYQVVQTHADELGFGFTKENEAEYQESLATMKTTLASQVGSEDPDLTYIQWLATVGLTDGTFASINQASLLFQNIQSGMYGEQGKEPVTDQVATDWSDETGTLRASHILISATPSEDGSDDGMAAALEKANTVREELRAAGDSPETFEALKTAHSQDTNPYTGAQNCPPEGYTFGPGEMVPQFEEGTKALAIGTVSEPVQSDYGYHIILRLDVKEACAAAKTDALVDSWMAAAQVEKTEACDALDLEAFYTKLTTLRETIQTEMFPQPEATDAPAETDAPADAGADSDAPASDAPAETTPVG